MSSSLAETGLISAGWLNVASWASVAQELPSIAPTATVTLSIAIGGIVLQVFKMYLDFRGREQVIELDRARHDLSEKEKVMQSREEESRRRDDELCRRIEEVEELRKLLYGKPQDHDEPRPPGADDGQPKPVD